MTYTFLQDAHKGMAVVNKRSRLDECLLKYLKLYVLGLLYADDTVLIAESAEDLQKSITLMKKF